METCPVKPRMPAGAACLGVTLAEYALILSAVGIVGVAGLTALRVSTVNLYEDTDQSLASGGTLSLLAPISSSGANTQDGVTPTGSGYYRVGSSGSGDGSLRLIDSNNGGGANVSSIEGDQVNSLGTARLASTLDKLAADQTDPELKNYYQQLAYYSYYMAGAEGELDNVPGLQIAGGGPNAPWVTDYTKGNALQDLYAYRNKLDNLLQKPPASLDQAELNQVMPLAADTFNIAQTYLNTFKDHLDANGKAKGNINTSDGDGKPGSSLDGKVKSSLMGVRMTNKTYDQMVGINQLRDQSRKLMRENKVDSAPVQTTLKNAIVTDEAAGHW